MHAPESLRPSLACVCLHVGFAVLLLVALLRLPGPGVTGAGLAHPGLAWLLAAVYLLGTVLEKRHSTAGPGSIRGRTRAWWLGGVCLLWLLLVWASADFVWLAFPLFFLQLHVLPLRLALPAIALSTVLVIAALWFHNGGRAIGSGRPLQLPMVLGPASAQPSPWSPDWPTGRCILEAENQRLAAEELRRTRAELARSQHDAGTLAERTRLAREIHDTLAQGFSSIVLMGRSAEKALDDGEPAAARDRLRTVRDTAAANLAEARNFVRGLQSPDSAEASGDLPEDPLVNSLRRLCEKTETEAAARGAGLRCRFDLEGTPVELPDTLPDHPAAGRAGKPRQRAGARQGGHRRRDPVLPGQRSGHGYLRRRRGIRPLGGHGPPGAPTARAMG